MNLHRWLQLTTALLAVLGATFLVLTGDQTLFPYALGIAALTALVVTDWYGWVKIPRGLGNLAALVSVGWTFREFMRLARDREAQLLTISHMLIYLQIVLVFQAKTRRVHWQLLVLSVLQVVVAAALAMGPQFGLLLTVYMATAIASMMLLCYQRDVIDEEPLLPSAKSPVSLHRLLDPPRLRVNDARQVRLEHWVNGRWLLRGVLMFTLGSVVFTLVFFFSAPRLSEAVWQTGRGRSAVSGFSSDVVLQTSGSIKLNDQPVMRVSFLNATTGRPMQLTTEPYFHGQVLTNYHQNEFGARWSYRPTDGLSSSSPFHVSEEARPGDMVKQEISIDATQSRLLFAMLPVKRLPETPSWVDEKRRSPRLWRTGHEEQLMLTRELRYSLGTLAIRNGRQLHAVPHFIPGESLNDNHDFHLELNHHREFDQARFPRLKAAADEVIRSQRLENESTLIRAIALRNYLYSSGQFQYSLRIDPPAAATTADPLEVFIAERRTGHCEYFASALVMLLRSQGIPARLVVGYKGGDWNPLGQYYLVRQKHAHAWVEVLLTASEVPPEEVAGKPSGSGAWYRLDPTPPSTEQLAAAENVTLAGRVSNFFDYADYLWRDYVLGLNSGRQEAVFEPLTNRSRELLPNGLEATTWQRWLRQTFKQTVPSKQVAVQADSAELSTTAVLWFTWLALLGVVIVAPALIFAAVLVVRASWSRTRRRKHGSPQTAPAFFVELNRILARHGIRAPQESTARELADLAATRLKLPAQPAGGSPLPAVLETIVAGYHRVRFGAQTLSPQDQAAIGAALVLLQQATPAPSPARSPLAK